MRRVVITGIGLVSPMGCDVPVVWDRIVSGKSGIRTIQQFDITDYASHIGGEVVEFDIDRFISKKEQRRTDPFSHFGISAAKLAMEDSGINMEEENPERTGVIVGSGIGGLQTMQTQYTLLKERGPSRSSPFMIPQMIQNMVSGLIAIQYGMKGPNHAVVSACATAAHAIGESLRIIERGEVDIMVSGGTDASICELGYAGFCALRALSTRNDAPEQASRPFDAERDGFVMAEGAAVLILEELEHAKKRGAKIYCELTGYGSTCDAFHETAPSEDGDGAARAMIAAVKDSNWNLDEVDYINAHGTSTKMNDKCETLAIKRAFGPDKAAQLMVSSTKSMTGHMLGAAGGMEAALCALTIRDGIVPPTINYENPDPDCDLDYVPNTARKAAVKRLISNSLGFGGHNVTLAFAPL